jgi:FdhE protein
MAKIGNAGHDAVPIGEISAPPFARLPDPATLFRTRAERFRGLAAGHGLKPYLEFLADVAECQHAIEGDLPEPALPPPDELGRSREFGMPALDRNRFPDEEACRETLRRFFEAMAAIDMPEPARQALGEASSAGSETQSLMAHNVLDGSIPFDAVAQHGFVAAALQVHAARAAARLKAETLVPVGDGACPACGSPPTTSLVVGWRGAHGARFCSCSLCGTLWNYVRIRCTACGSTKGITYQEIDGTDGSIKAECCSECRTFLKILHQAKNPALDPVADDVASSALDLLVTGTGMRRSGTNPFLLGY